MKCLSAHYDMLLLYIDICHVLVFIECQVSGGVKPTSSTWCLTSSKNRRMKLCVVIGLCFDDVHWVVFFYDV